MLVLGSAATSLIFDQLSAIDATITIAPTKRLAFGANESQVSGRIHAQGSIRATKGVLPIQGVNRGIRCVGGTVPNIAGNGEAVLIDRLDVTRASASKKAFLDLTMRGSMRMSAAAETLSVRCSALTCNDKTPNAACAYSRNCRSYCVGLQSRAINADARYRTSFQ